MNAPRRADPPLTVAGGSRFLRTLTAIALAASLLSWLFLQADAIDARAHQDYSRELRLLRQADAELNAAILASRAGLQTDFDSIVAALDRLHGMLARLDKLPDFLPEEDKFALQADLSRFRDALHHKAHRTDLFKREFAVLRNSLAYLPVVTNSIVDAPGAQIQFTRPVGIFVRGVMTHSHSGNDELGLELKDKLAELEAGVDGLQGEARARLHNVLLHARVVLDSKPVVDRLMREILAVRTASLSEALNQSYALGYERASRQAHNYRSMLYVLALALAGYLAHTLLRVGRTSRQLAQLNLSLKERLQALDRAQQDLRLYATVFTSATEGMTITDSASRIVAVNPAFTKITGYQSADIVGETPARLSSGRQDASFYRDMWTTLARDGQWQGEIWNRRRNGEIYPEWLSITAVGAADGQPTHYIGIFSDITDRKAAEARIHHLAHHDALTNLPNRSLLQDRLEQAILQARRNRRHAAVLFIDLDRFKLINDSLGHELGDGLLIQVSERCQTVVRDTDTVARHGGDEFAIVLPELEHPQDAAPIARKLLQLLGRPYRLGDHELTVTASIGIAVYPDDGDSASLLLRNADAAMYGAKGEGRNSYQFYSADFNTASLAELLLENQLRGALDRDELRLHYQPKVNAHSGAIVGAEALVRWQHPEFGLLGPGRFIPAAEEAGLIGHIGEWVLRAACRQLRAWLDAGLQPVRIAVNLSAQQLAHDGIVDLVETVLRESRLSPALLELELTETMLMRDVDHATEVLHRLRALGIHLAIDDFGTGYSSLAYLQRFEVDVLKIDRSFVNDITEPSADGRNGGGGRIAAAVIALAHSLGQSVVAEGVETAEQRDFLRAQGCDVLQGYLYSRPLPPEDFVRMLQQPASA